MWPYRSDELNPTPLRDVINPTVEARLALAEGQFPLRVAPRHLRYARYPLFQFYGNLPFTLCGLADTVPGVSPYLAWRLVMLLTLTCGGYFTFRCAYRLTRHAPASLAAGALLVTAPYLLTDLYQRTAYSELTALCLLPAALLATMRCFASRRRRVINTVAGAGAWTLVGLSHNITYLYGVTFVGLYFLLQAPVASIATGRWGAAAKYASRLSRLAAAGV